MLSNFPSQSYFSYWTLVSLRIFLIRPLTSLWTVMNKGFIEGISDLEIGRENEFASWIGWTDVSITLKSYSYYGINGQFDD